MIRKLIYSAIAFTSIGTSSAQTIGVNAVVKNDVTVRAAVASGFSPAMVGEDVMLRDTIRSGNESALQVLLLDETVFTVGANAELTVDRFIYDPDRGTGEMAVSATQGAFRFMSGRTASDPDNVTIDTPVASMGVRGTIAEGAVGGAAIARVAGRDKTVGQFQLDENDTLFVLRGPGKDNTSLNKDGAIVVSNNWGSVTLTKSNTAVLVQGQDEPIIGPFQISAASMEGFSQDLRTTPSGRLVRPVPAMTLPRLTSLTPFPMEPFFDVEREQVQERPLHGCQYRYEGQVIGDSAYQEIYNGELGIIGCYD